MVLKRYWKKFLRDLDWYWSILTSNTQHSWCESSVPRVLCWTKMWWLSRVNSMSCSSTSSGWSELCLMVLYPAASNHQKLGTLWSRKDGHNQQQGFWMALKVYQKYATKYNQTQLSFLSFLFIAVLLRPLVSAMHFFPENLRSLNIYW